jgi:hypothetical protein
LLVAASLLSLLAVRPALRSSVDAAASPTAAEPPTAAAAATPLHLAECRHCGLAAPQLHPGAASSTSSPDR